ncbi:unnamed protein product [Discosporangium mesarthrocarpum]
MAVEAKEKVTLSKEEAQAEMQKLLEFYFGNSNFHWDRFMQSKAGKTGDGVMLVEILLKFNKLKLIVEQAGLSEEEATAVITAAAEASEKLRVEKDGDKPGVGRKDPLSEEMSGNIISRTVQVRNFPKETVLQVEGVEAVFEPLGKVCFVKIFRARGRKITSVFVEFEEKEKADEVVEKAKTGEIKFEGEALTIRKLHLKKGDREEDKDDKDAEGEEGGSGEGEKSNEKQSKVEFVPGKIIQVKGIPTESSVSREILKEAFKIYGAVKYVDYSFNLPEAWIRMEEPEQASQAVVGTKEKGIHLGEGTEARGQVSLLDGEEEEAYWAKVQTQKSERAKAMGGKRGKPRRGQWKGKRDTRHQALISTE